LNRESALLHAELTVTGRVVSASNLVLQGSYPAPGGVTALCVYKPARGEKPLWDFPGQVLGHHEVAAFLVAAALGWPIVPTTVWREDAPAGAGSVQEWLATDVTDDVGVFSPPEVPPAFLPVLTGTGPDGRDVAVAHRDTERLRDIALFDAVINNSDRKAGHLLGDGDAVMAIDHGVAFHHEDKLRTVLWGFAGQPIGGRRQVALASLHDALATSPAQPAGGGRGQLAGALDSFLDEDQQTALLARVDRLLADPRFPLPVPGWPAVPWPLW
jgi:uncharacterized repeat protein (TIGR03843 family)